MDPAPVTLAFQHALVASLVPLSEPLAALHRTRAGVLGPLDCPRCGHRPLATRKTARAIERTCSRCRTVTRDRLAPAKKPTFRRPALAAQPAPPERPVDSRKAVSSQPAPPPPAPAKRRKHGGLEKLLAQNRQRQAQTQMSADPFAFTHS